MYRTLYTILISFLAVVYCQTTSADVFFLDMGIAIEARNGSEKISRQLIKPYTDINNKKVVRNNEVRSVYMATTSEVFSSLDKINDQVSAIEKSFTAKLETLEIENSRLRDQVISLNQKLNSEIINIDYKSIIDIKPMAEVSAPIESDHISVDIIGTDLPVDETENIINKSLGFDGGIYASGMISYNNEEYEKCIQYFKSLSLIEANKRTSGNILLLLSESYEQIGRYKQALIHLNKLSELGVAKYSDLVLIKRGMIYRNMGMNNKAQEMFKSLVSIYPDSKYVSLAQAEINNI
tara:strand:+ start:68 stop:949 length:882 start_codon:yes stop_codon:yes gene_type:complete